MATQGELIDRIARELDREGEEDAIRDALHETFEDIERRGLWPQDTRRARLTTKRGQKWYSVLDDSLSSISGDMGCEPLSEICDPIIAGKIRDFVEIDAIQLMHKKCDNGCCNFPPRTRPLYQVGHEEFTCFDDCYSGGCPTHFAYYAGQIGIYPAPDCSYKLAICGMFKHPKPKKDTDTHPLLEDATELLKRGAKLRFFADYLEDEASALKENVLFERQIRLLRKERTKREFSGKIGRAKGTHIPGGTNRYYGYGGYYG